MTLYMKKEITLSLPKSGTGPQPIQASAPGAQREPNPHPRAERACQHDAQTPARQAHLGDAILQRGDQREREHQERGDVERIEDRRRAGRVFGANLAGATGRRGGVLAQPPCDVARQ